MEIKMMTPQDAEAYYVLRLEALLDSPHAFATLYEDALNRPIDKTRENLAAEHAVTFGAYEGGRLVGQMTLTRNTVPKMNHRAAIVAVYVSPQFRGTGVAHSLMEKTLDFAGNWEGLEVLDLMVASHNLRAKNFYLQYGFETYGTQLRSMKSGSGYIDEDLMVKFIS